MASLIGPLAVGFAACPSGSVLINSTGTGTPSIQVYSDAAGTILAATHPLDAFGGVVRYTKEIVDVTVLTAAGATHRAFTHVDDARVVALENYAFNGVLPGGGTGAGGRTTEDIAWTRMLASLGAVDGQVSVGGVPMNISTALGSSAAVYFNVKSYGAVGNGVADDTAAVQSAITAAANAGGGIVYYPPATYLLGNISIPPSVPISMLGAGPTVSVLRTKSTVAGAFNDATSTVYSELGFRVGTLSTGVTSLWTTSTADSSVTFNHCYFGRLGDSNTVTGYLSVSANGARVFLNNCRFIQGTNAVYSSVGTTNSRVYFSGCAFPAAAGNAIQPGANSHAYFTGCDLEIASATPGAAWIAGSTGVSTWAGGTIVGNFGGAGTANVCGGPITISGAHLRTAAGSVLNLGWSGGTVVDGGNWFDRSAGTVNLRVDTAGIPPAGVSVSRGANTAVASVAGTTYTPDLVDNRTIRVTQTSGASLAFASAAGTQTTGPGDYTWLVYKNSSGGAITPTFDAGFVVSPALVPVTNTRTSVYEVRSLGTSTYHVRALIEDSTAAL